MGELLAALKVRQCALADFPVRPAELAELLELLASGTLPRSVARQVFARMMATGHPPARIVEEEGLTQVRDDGAIERWVAEAVEAYRAEAERVLAGEARLLSFFVGQVMRRSGGKANPGQVSRVLRERLR